VSTKPGQLQVRSNLISNVCDIHIKITDKIDKSKVKFGADDSTNKPLAGWSGEVTTGSDGTYLTWYAKDCTKNGQNGPFKIYFDLADPKAADANPKEQKVVFTKNGTTKYQQTDIIKENTTQVPTFYAGMYFPGTPRDGQTYAVLFTDTGVVCTFGRSEPIRVPLTPTDANFTPIPGDAVPPGGGAPTDTPKTPIDTPKAPTDQPPPAGTPPPVLADKLGDEGPGIFIKDDPNWTWDPKGMVYVNKKDPKIKRPVPKSIKPGQMWDPEGDPDGTSPIEPKTSGNSRTFIDPKTGKIIAKLFVDDQGHVYERQDDFDGDNKSRKTTDYYPLLPDPLTGKFDPSAPPKIQQQDTTDPKTGIRTTEQFDRDGKLTARTEYWPGGTVKKVEENFDGDNKPGKTTEYPPPSKTAADLPSKDTTKTGTDSPPPGAPVTPTAATPTDDVVILFKGDQEALERGKIGDPLNGQHLMLAFKTPELRDSGPGKPAKDDSGFDKDGVHAVTGPDGQAKLIVPAEDRALYLPSLGDHPQKTYRIDAVAPRNTGSVSEIARNAKPDLTGGAPQDGNVAAEVFTIGTRTFVRRLYTAPYAEKVSLPSGQKDDWCRVVEPGPALGMEPEYASAELRELPEATVKLPRATGRGRDTP
jgi:hypothetical protein